jgi:hypothetical protein
MLVLGFYSGLPGRVRTVYLSVCVVSLLSSRLIAGALVWFPNFLKYLVFQFFISLSTVFICRSSWIQILTTFSQFSLVNTNRLCTCTYMYIIHTCSTNE